MDIKIKRKDELPMSVWSGGTTTQLEIYPPSALYGARNFLWRISTATVDEAESTFTSLPDYQRIIMPLTGELTIRHADHYEKILLPLQTDNFHGAWHTTSAGKVRDFNLMLGAGAQGLMRGFEISDTINIDCTELLHTGAAHLAVAFYLLQGEAMFTIPTSGNKETLAAGDFMLITYSREITPLAIVVNKGASTESCILAMVQIAY